MKKETIIRNRENLFALYKEIALKGNGTLKTSKYFNWVDCPPSSWPSTIFNSDVHKANFPIVIDGIQRGIIPAFWIRLREMDLEEVNVRFAENGFKHLAAWAGMCLDLEELPNRKKACPASLQEVKREEDLETWIQLANQTLFKTRQIDELLFKTLFHASDQIRFYLAKVDQKAVAITLSFSNQKTVGIYAVATLEDFRKQGISSALTHFALAAAKEKGCDMASLQATAMGESVYRNLGFKGIGIFDVYWLLAY